MKSVAITVTSTLLSALGVYLFTEFSDFVYGNFIGLILGVVIVATGLIALCTARGFSKVNSYLGTMERSGLRSTVMMFCNILLDKEHIKSVEMAYLFKLEEDCKNLGLNGYLQNSIDLVKEKHKLQ